MYLFVIHIIEEIRFANIHRLLVLLMYEISIEQVLNHPIKHVNMEN